jgi:glutaredoxin-like protein NrdH
MTLTLYIKPANCFACDKTKQKFTEAGIEFTAIDITTNEQALAYISEELGYSQAPVVLYERDGTEDHWSGLNPPKIAHVIALESTNDS